MKHTMLSVHFSLPKEKQPPLPKRHTRRKSSGTPARASVVLLLTLLLIIVLMPASFAHATPAVTIDWNDVHQTIDGFGASGAFGQANSLKNVSEPARTTILDALFSQTSGAGLSIVRNIINDGQSGATIEPSLGNWVWTGDTDQIWLMQQAQSRGETRFISTVWSPPGWMKDNGRAVGGSLAASHYQDFADYLSRYVREYNSRFGLPIHVVSLANEPGVSVSYSSCNWTGAQFHDFIKNNLLPTFQTDGVDVKVMIPEKAEWDETLANESLADDVTAARVDIVGGHDYHVTLPNTITPFTNALSHGKPVWETEVSELTKANDPSITDGLKWATQVHNFMVADTSAFLHWWLIEGDRSDSEALVQLSGSSYTLNKRLYTLGNYARFIRPGFVRIGSTEQPATNILTTAYRDPASNKFVLVVVNNNASSQTIDIAPDGFSTGSLTPYVTDGTHNLVQLSDVFLSGVTLAANSVTTFVGNATGPTHNLTMAVSPSGGGTTTPSLGMHSYSEGATVNVSATANPAYVFSSWSGDVADPNSASTTVTMDGDKTVTANFTALPTVTINQAAAQADPTNSSPIHFTATFSESVSDFATGDVTLSGSAGATTATVTGSGTTYDVAVSGMSQAGTVIASIAAGVAHDAAGTPNAASTSSDNQVTYNEPYTLTLKVGWNLVAAATGTSFPSTLFGWNGASYESVLGPLAWQGYWCKVTEEQTVEIETVVGPQTISLTTGWNLIGNSTSSPAALTLPTGRTAFVYDGTGSTYESTPTLLPGQGAWVKGDAGEEVILTPTI
jgi:glucuronoarabinoxylan endo-1,4-beta-xylanase